MAFLAPRKERVLIYGPAKAGKSFTYIGLMDFAKKTKTDSHFWIIDNDNATDGMGLFPGGPYSDLLGDEIGELELPWKAERAWGDDEGAALGQEYENATIWVPETFDDYNPIAAHIRKSAKPNDFVIIDMLSNVWEMMPDWWIENVYGDNTWDYYAKVRAQIENPELDDDDKDRSFGGHSGVDWKFIGKVYRKWEKSLTTFSKCHTFVYSSESEIQSFFDKTGEKRAQYAIASGYAPKTEKGLPHRVHSYMRLTRRLGKDGKTTVGRDLTVVGDRGGREEVWKEKYGRSMTMELSEGPKFAWDYLVKVGGWKPAGG